MSGKEWEGGGGLVGERNAYEKNHEIFKGKPEEYVVIVTSWMSIKKNILYL